MPLPAIVLHAWLGDIVLQAAAMKIGSAHQAIIARLRPLPMQASLVLWEPTPAIENN
jgi:hypothetical protein